MIFIDKFTVLPTATFKEELGEIMYYFKHKLKEPQIAKRFYARVIDEINSLEFMPERYKKIEKTYKGTRILRRTSIDQYLIIYEVNNETRSSIYFTYIS